MNNALKYIFTLTLFLSVSHITKAQVLPAFTVTAGNYELKDTLGGTDNLLEFDITILHTNPAQSGNFVLAGNQYHFNFNPDIANGGTLTYSIVPGSSGFSNQDCIPRNPQISGDQLRLGSNVPQGQANSPVISSVFPGTRVVRMKLMTSANSLAAVNLNLLWRTAMPAPYSLVSAYIGDINTILPNTANGTYITNLSPALNLTLLPEGFYNSNTNKMIPDTATVYLRNPVSPYLIKDSSKAVLDSNGNASFIFTKAINGTPFYLIVKHRNSLETWSSSHVSFSNNQANYDFTISGAQAFGNNLKLKGSRYCIFSGDVNQDGTVDLSDLGAIYNSGLNFGTGYLSTDLTGDSTVDLSDLSIAYNNGINFAGVIKP